MCHFYCKTSLKKTFCQYWHDLSVAVCYSVCHAKSQLNNSKTDYPIYVKFSANIPVDVSYKLV
jgi:hypothetical protein